MKSILKSFIILLIATFYVQAQESVENSCVSCHAELDSTSATHVQLISESVHSDKSLSCQGCHGGDPAEEDPDLAMSPKKGFIGAPKKSEVSKVCAKCHSDVSFMRNYNPNISTDQYARYLTSRHGELLAKGDLKVATCIDCHGFHDIKNANNPTSAVFPRNIADTCGKCHADKEYMSEYGIPTNQMDEYKNSVHAEMMYEKGDLSAPTCNDCHGNHSAMPPDVEAVAHVCGTCHYIQSEFFASSPHKKVFDDMGIAECEACHGNHEVKKASKEMLGTGENAVCMDCHDKDSQGYKVAAVMRAAIDTLDYQIRQAEAMLEKAHQAGVEVPSEKILAINRAKDELTQSQTAIHTFSADKVLEITAKGREEASVALAVGASALKELVVRRRMLIIMVVLTLIVAGLLVLYIRQREQGQA